MSDFEVRELIAFGVIAAGVLGGLVLWTIQRRRRYWRKLRMTGHPEAKRRELGKR